MKKLILMALLVAFAIGCTTTSIEEDYETETQAIEHSEVGDDNDDEEYMEGNPG